MDVRTPIAMPNTGRDITIDVAKGIGILLVILSHVYYLYGPLTYIYSFHMPLFFVLAGLVFRRDRYATFGQFLKKRFRTLICPYLIFYGTALLVTILSVLFAEGLPGILTKDMLRTFLQMFLAKGVTNFANNPLWFVPCLLCVELMYYFISGLKRPLIVVICTALVFFGWFWKAGFLSWGWKRFYWNFDVACFAIGYYALGNLLAQPVKQLLSRFENHRRRLLLSLAAALVCAALVLPPAMLNDKISLGSTVYNNGFLLYITGTVGTLAVLLAAVAFRRCPFLQFLGQNTFALMGTHYIIRNLFNDLCTGVLGTTYNDQSLFHAIPVFIAVLLLSLGCVLLYNLLKSRTKKEAV